VVPLGSDSLPFSDLSIHARRWPKCFHPQDTPAYRSGRSPDWLKMKNSDAPREAGSRGRLGQKEMAMNGKNRIMIYGPKADGTYQCCEARPAPQSR
jgi:hypothetical protein